MLGFLRVLGPALGLGKVTATEVRAAAFREHMNSQDLSNTRDKVTEAVREAWIE